MNTPFRRALCLILALSMITPLAADAATLLHPYPSVTVTANDGTTNEMAYVDQFFDEDGNFTSTGPDVKKWIDMLPRSGNKRTNSGYLMLEQEIEHQARDGSYIVSDVYIEMSRTALETVGSLGTNLVEAAVAHQRFKDKFPNSGTGAYIYYNYLYQLYFEYLGTMQERMAEAENAHGAMEYIVDTATELIVNNQTREVIQYRYSDSFAVVPENFNGEIKTIEVTKITAKKKIVNGVEQMDIIYTVKGAGTKRDLYNLLKETNDGKGVVINLDDAVEKLKSGKVTDYFNQDLAKLGKTNKLDVSELKTGAALGCVKGVKSSKGFSKLPESVQDALKKAENKFKKTVDRVVIPSRVANTINALGNAAGVLSAIDSINTYYEERQNMTARQQSYMSALASCTQDYLNTLYQWSDAIMSSDLDPTTKKAINDAVTAMILDILTVHKGTQNELEQHIHATAASFSAGKLTEAIFASADAVAGVAGASGILQEMVTHFKGAKAGTNLVNATMFCSLGSAVLNACTQQFVDFGDSSAAIYYLKWSLHDLIEDLLNKYKQNRTHETACEIINALDAMKSAKIMGENLVSDYYLYKFYHDEGVQVGGNAHMILWSELMKWDGSTDLDITCTDVVGVYCYSGNPLPESVAGDVLREDVTIDVLGYYLKAPNDEARYMNVPLTTLPKQYQELPKNDTLASYGKAQTVNKQWLDEKPITSGTTQWVYLQDLKLYSNHGVEAVVTEAEYNQCIRLQNRLNQLIKDLEDKVIPEDSKDAQFVCRIDWTLVTRKYIESLKMYDPSIDYKQKAYYQDIVRDSNPN